MAKRRAQTREQFADREWLFDIVVGAEIQGGDLLDLAVARRENDYRRRRELPGLRQDVLAVHVGKAEIENDEIGRGIGGHAQRLAAGSGVLHLITRGLERRAQETQDLRFVVDDEDAGAAHDAALAGAGASAAGNATTSRAPRLRTAGLSAQIRPPIASTRPLAIERPRPTPVLRPSERPP